MKRVSEMQAGKYVVPELRKNKDLNDVESLTKGIIIENANTIARVTLVSLRANICDKLFNLKAVAEIIGSNKQIKNINSKLFIRSP